MNKVGQYSVNGPKGIICTTEESSIEETEANARLISMAPCMLEMLERVLKNIPKDLSLDGLQLESDLKTIIHQIKGESN
jgi:hypothetical protein